MLKEKKIQQTWRKENNEQRQICRTNTIEGASQLFLQAGS